MKKRTAFIGAILSLIPLGQPLLIGTGAVFISSAAIHSLSAKAEKNNAQFYYERGVKKLDKGIYKGAISDYTKAIEINPEYEDAYYDRGVAKEIIKDYVGAVSDRNRAFQIYSKDKLKISIENIIAPAMYKKTRSPMLQGFNRFAKFNGRTYQRPITYYLHDKSGKLTEILSSS